MGADLEIVETGKTFRDSYNPSNIWWVLGMSYWTWYAKLKKLGRAYWNENLGAVTPKGVKLIYAAIKKRKLTTERLDRNYKRSNYSNKKQAFAWWKKHDKEMRAFWKEAIETNSAVEFSV